MNIRIRHLALGALLYAGTSALAAPPVDYGHVGDRNVCSDPRVNVDERIDKCKTYLTSGGLTAEQNAAAVNSLGLAYLEKGDAVAGLDAYNTALKLDPKAWYAYLNRTNLYLSQGKDDLALDDCNAALAIKPDAWQVYAIRASIHRKRGEHDLELADFTHAVQINPTAQTYRLRGEAYAEGKDTAQALADYNESMKLEPENVRTLFHRAQLNAKMGNREASVADYHQILALSRHQTVAPNIVARAEYAGHLDADAARDFTAELAADPADADALTWRGYSYLRMQKYDLAIADFNAVLAAAPRNFEVLDARSAAYEALGDNTRALADADAALAIAPDSEQIANSACWMRALTNTDLAHAEDICKRAIALKPAAADLRDSLGFVQYRLGRLADARASYDAAILIDGKEAPSFYMRGIIRRATGDASGGDADLAAAMALDPDIAKTFAGYGVSK